jgi:hypothetical protein
MRKRIKEVERLKEEGNSAFKRGGDGLDEAVGKYGEALEVVGSAEEEGKGGQIRATLLSNRATTLVKVCALSSLPLLLYQASGCGVSISCSYGYKSCCTALPLSRFRRFLHRIL